MIALLLAAAPSPSPSPAKKLDATTVTPGLVGFLVTFALVVVAIGLFQLMTRSLRRATRNAKSQGIEVTMPGRVGAGVQLPTRAPEPTAPGVLDGGAPFGTAARDALDDGPEVGIDGGGPEGGTDDAGKDDGGTDDGGTDDGGGGGGSRA